MASRTTSFKKALTASAVIAATSAASAAVVAGQGRFSASWSELILATGAVVAVMLIIPTVRRWKHTPWVAVVAWLLTPLAFTFGLERFMITGAVAFGITMLATELRVERPRRSAPAS